MDDPITLPVLLLQPTDLTMRHYKHVPNFSVNNNFFHQQHLNGTSSLNNIKYSDSKILKDNDFAFTGILLFGDTSFNDHTNTRISDSTGEYIISTIRFNEFLFTSIQYYRISL